jgi:hypothetical protein
MGHLLLLTTLCIMSSCSSGSILSGHNKKSTSTEGKTEEEAAPSTYVDVSTLTEAAVSIHSLRD